MVKYAKIYDHTCYMKEYVSTLENIALRHYQMLKEKEDQIGKESDERQEEEEEEGQINSVQVKAIDQRAFSSTQ